MGPGMTNQTVIQRTTEVTSVTIPQVSLPIIGLLIASPVKAADVEVFLRLLIQSQTV